MITVTLTQAKKDFPNLVEKVRQGESVVITLGRHKVPAATLSAIISPLGE